MAMTTKEVKGVKIPEIFVFQGFESEREVRFLTTDEGTTENGCLSPDLWYYRETSSPEYVFGEFKSLEEALDTACDSLWYRESLDESELQKA